MQLKRISPKVAESLGYYVYLYIDPTDGKPFYVGQGKGNRVLAHLNDQSESPKVQKISEIHDRGREPRIDILIHGLPDEETAMRIEASVIDLLGKDQLANQVGGWGNGIVGRMKLSDLAAMYAAEPVEIDVPVILIRINHLYRYGMSADELYDATRGIWRVNPELHQPKYAFSVYRGIVREVYEIKKWYKAGTTSYHTRIGWKIDFN